MSEFTEVVPAELRSWAVAWKGYAPRDVTPPELLPAALAAEVPAWAEGAATPNDVHDWERRRADALVRFELDVAGWPLHPLGRTGRTGRNLGRWGENAAADPIVVTGSGRDRRLLLITRSDVAVEAIPGAWWTRVRPRRPRWSANCARRRAWTSWPTVR